VNGRNNNMGLRDLPLKNAYDSDIDNILVDFYAPALAVSTQYDRLSGFFSSTSLAAAAKGISGLIRNGGYIRLVTGATFQEEDIIAIRSAIDTPERVLEQSMLREFDNLEDEFTRDHVRALGWMVAKGKLKIKIALVLDYTGVPLESREASRQGIFHQKVGILEDIDGNKISFSGSDNESARGWHSNIEEFKVFRSWVAAENEYFEADLSKFKKFWLGNARRTRILDIPKAIEERLIKIAPNSIEELDLDKWIRRSEPVSGVQLREYQKKAVQRWFENGKNGIFEMATGSGKTITALCCLDQLSVEENRLITVISSPYIHLGEQWLREANKIGVQGRKVIADSSQSRWKDTLVDSILDIENRVNEKLLVFTTHSTFSSSDFISIIEDCKKKTPHQKILLIVDEVHGIGAPQRRRGLINEYDFRLGLSATPKRWFDFEGTDKIFDYFGNVVFEFSLKDAIDAGYLTPYVYKPHFTSLTQAELESYETETRKISKAYYRTKDENEKDEIYTLLCIKRQKIIRNATNKLVVFRKLLDEMPGVKYCLVYSSPQQIRSVQDILNEKNVIQHKFTEDEGTRADDRFGGLSERDFLIKQFSSGVYHALVSMKCLDEGVDVPPARIAIMLDNSGNPREYIQRRGRVLRKYPGKERAIIHDIIVEPTIRSSMPKELGELERKIISKELERYRDFAKTAQNSEECLKIMENVESIYGVDQEYVRRE
jgi:superfamily II DNA or RNA helicase